MELQDARGCLTEAGLRAFAHAVPGRAPSELALHVAGCARCQERVLAADLPPAPGRRRGNPTTPGRMALLLTLFLLSLFGLLWTVRLLLRG